LENVVFESMKSNGNVQFGLQVWCLMLFIEKF